MTYLDPKADLTFKKVFGEHPDIVMSFLNALLPLEEGEEITEIEYLPTELIPEHPLRKYSIVDVRCKDSRGRHFIVEMQMVCLSLFQNVLHAPIYNSGSILPARSRIYRLPDSGNRRVAATRIYAPCPAASHTPWRR